ncbi:MAG: DUF421 domain-containing protein [Clostridia bacterium]|nr:DUF421 domain-containing protein [Clostridia bacterium]
MDFIALTLTSLLSILALFVIGKLMGHKQLSQLDFFDYITGITIGSIAAELATELDRPWKPLVAMILYGAVSILLSFISHKLPKMRRYINGVPTVLMNNDKIYRENLKKAKLDLNEFLLLCRELGYFDLTEIQTAVFEENGHLSIMPKSEARPITPRDISLPAQKSEISSEIIMDGRVLTENLSKIGKDERWLKKELFSLGYKNEREIFLAVYKEASGLTVYGI